jgi:hypothetical protein
MVQSIQEIASGGLMSESGSMFFEIHAAGIDSAALEKELRKRAATRADQGHDTLILEETAAKFDLKSVRNEDDFLRFFLERLQELHQVDINDFPITTHRGSAGKPIKLLKTGIWKLLKFYTYRLFSQQNQINGQLAAALEAILRKSEDRIRELEARITELEQEAQSRSTAEGPSAPDPGEG